MNEYREVERGRFDSRLLCDGIEIAYTDYNVVKIVQNNYTDEDHDAVKAFAEFYDLPISFFPGIIEDDF